MKRTILSVAIAFGGASGAWSAEPVPLTTLRAIHALNFSELGRNLPVAFEATVTYSHADQFFFFVEYEGTGLFVVRGPVDTKLSAGDRLLVRGRTAAGVQPFVKCEGVTLLRHGGLPSATPANLDQLTHGKFDARRVKVRGVIQTVDPPQDSNGTTYLQLFTSGGFIDVIVDSDLLKDRDRLLGATVELQGVAAARLDDRYRHTGVQIFVAADDDIKVLRRPVPARANAAGGFTTLRSIHALSQDEIGKNLPVAFEATIIAKLVAGRLTMIVQDDGAGIYVRIPVTNTFIPGDRVLVRGKLEPGIQPLVDCDRVTLLRHGSLPKPIPASFEELIHIQRDCLRVKVRGVIRAADLAWGADGPTFLQLHTDRGTIDAYLDNNEAKARDGLRDAEVDVTGVATIKLDGKGQQTGILLFVSSIADINILKHPETNFRSIHLTPMNEVFASFQVNDLTQRVRVRGAITYSQPGSSAVLQSGSESLWIQTQSNEPLRIGDQADATGFPILHDGFLALAHGVIQDGQQQTPITPIAATWKQLSSSLHIFDLVSTEGRVLTEIREDSQDEYVLGAGGNLFTAIYRHPSLSNQHQVEPMKMIPVGAKVRVTGICVLKDSNPYNGPVPFDILLRSFSDILVIAGPSLLNVHNLIVLVYALLMIVFIVAVRSWAIERKVNQKTAVLAARIEADAAMERRSALIEQKRSIILEDINRSQPLPTIIQKVVEMVSVHLDGVSCWCDVGDELRVGNCPPKPHDLRIVRVDVDSRSNSVLGALFAAFPPRMNPSAGEVEALSSGARLATLAIETRRLYSDLRRRSEFDLLTDTYNRFSLHKRLDFLLQEIGPYGIFGLIYIDLDKFKAINDTFGHLVGDAYLQEAAMRMKDQLLGGDMLARLGGDEFGALVSLRRGRIELDKVVARLEGCFDKPFIIGGHVLEGSASIGTAIYPNSGATKDALLNAADAAMYAIKKNRQKEDENLLAQKLQPTASLVSRPHLCTLV